jgi:outer membrane lipoprotein-sorting protein
MRDDRALALELDRALAGGDAGAEARELATLLTLAAEPARFEVPEDELERALARTRPAPRRAPRPRLVLAFAIALVLATAAALVLRTPANDVEAKAAGAIDHAFFVVEEIRPAKAGLFPPTTSSGYVDSRGGRAHWRVTSGGDLVSETVVDDGRVKRYDAADDTLTVASSCSAFASGCADVLNPLDLYRRALGNGTTKVEKDGDDWRLTLRGAADVEQIVTVDGKTYLPTSIEWREHGRPVSTVEFIMLERETPAAEQFTMDEHPGAQVRQLTATGAPVRVLSERATTVPAGAYWLGPEFDGRQAIAFDVHTTGGDALRIEYGPFVVWNYDAYLPPEVVAAATGAAKVFPLPQGGVARTYFNASGLVVADVEIGGRRVAVVAPGKTDIFRAAQALRRHP